MSQSQKNIKNLIRKNPQCRNLISRSISALFALIMSKYLGKAAPTHPHITILFLDFYLAQAKSVYYL